MKSPEELEAEDREAQSAVSMLLLVAYQTMDRRLMSFQKLQELIRRGTPRDLQAAQELMKTLAGAVSTRIRSIMPLINELAIFRIPMPNLTIDRKLYMSSRNSSHM